MSLADNIAEQFIEAISRFTPEYINKINKAKADGLKLTEPEQKKRDEYNATINATNIKLDELKKASDRHDLKRAELDGDIKKLTDRVGAIEEREDKAKEREDAVLIRENAVKIKNGDFIKRESDLEKIKNDQQKEKTRLEILRGELEEQATSFEQAQKLIKRK
jgi:hypothetical protein